MKNMIVKNYGFREIFFFILTLFLTVSIEAQTSEKLSYQAVIRDGNAELVKETQVGMQISILQGSANGTVVYTETQTPTTNVNGLLSIEIGGGAGFETIDWADGIFFIKTEVDPTGGNNYSISNTSQFLSVPYALHAKTAAAITGNLNELDPRVPYGNTVGEMQYWNGAEWVIVAAGTEGDVLTFINNKPSWGGESPLGTVINPTTGETWMDKNLGASQVATASDDPNSYGDLYQWGRLTDGHEKRTSTTTTTRSSSDVPGHGNFILNPVEPSDWRNPQNGNLWQGVNGINNPCPTGFRLPTVPEWEAQLQSWSSNNSAGAFASPLKLPVAGFRHHDDGSLNMVDSGGFYWASDLIGTHSRSSGFSSTGAYVGGDRRGFGFSVRCIKD